MSFRLPSVIPSPFMVTRHTGRLEASDLSTTGGSVPGGKILHVRDGQVGDGRRVDIRIGVRLEIDANNTDAVREIAIQYGRCRWPA